MTQLQKDKIARFLEDTLLSDTIRDILLENALNQPIKQYEIHYLAAQRLAIDIIRESWKEMERYRSQSEKKETTARNIGL